jgi:isopenicillin N synthase-like dioxygenase
VLPAVDIGPLVRAPVPPDAGARLRVGAAIGSACEEFGFFTITGHGVDPQLRRDLLDVAAEFFALPDREKARIAMRHGGRAWRGWFGVGDELTAGRPDGKEGLYLGSHLDPAHPAVREGRMLHGPNLYPRQPARLRAVVDRWMTQVAAVGRAVLVGMAIGLGLDEDWFDRWCADPTVLFRMFHYPPPPTGPAPAWGVGEHTDYGLLTLLAQDDTGGLEVRLGDRWVPVPADPDSFVCNLGDMLERATGGRYRSTTHRVAVPSRDRYSFPLFLDPSWDAVVEPIPGMEPTAEARRRSTAGRWDDADLFAGTGGTYGDYLSRKVAGAFPGLHELVTGR